MKLLLMLFAFLLGFVNSAQAHAPDAVPKAIGGSFLIGLSAAGVGIALVLRWKPQWPSILKVIISLTILILAIVLSTWLFFIPIYEFFGG